MPTNEYMGYTILQDPEAISEFYSGDKVNTLGLKVNEYLMILDGDGNIKDTYRVNKDGRFVKVLPRTISSRFLGNVDARNPQQMVAIDMLYNEEMTIKMIAGKFGSGKTFLMSSAAVDLLERHRFERIVYVRNNIEVKNSKPIGFLPGTYTEKLMPFAAPLADHLGGTSGLEMMMGDRKVEVMHLGFIRGRDIRNSIIFCSEAENLTKEHVQLLISRVGEGSELWLDGDVKQKDAEVFVRNSGMAVTVDRLAGHKLFGYVKLIKTERSETAALADLLDDAPVSSSSEPSTRSIRDMMESGYAAAEKG